MMAICPICGKRTVIHWPEHWVYRRGPTYYCSDNCMYVDATRDLQMMHQAIHKRKEAWKMARMKKDGTPAKKPGRKPAKTMEEIKEEMAEDGVELVYDPSIAEEYRREQEQKKANEAAKAEAEKEWTPAAEVYGREADEEDDRPPMEERDEVIKDEDFFLVTAVKNSILGEFYYDHDHNCIDWRNGIGDEVSLEVSGWKMLARRLPGILRYLGVEV